MRGLLYLGALLALTVLAFWAVYDRPPGGAMRVRVRTIAFDNLYGDAGRLPVFVKVGDLSEQRLTAACDPTTCTFELPLTNAVHDLTLAIEHNGKRSAPTKIQLDARAPR